MPFTPVPPHLERRILSALAANLDLAQLTHLFELARYHHDPAARTLAVGIPSKPVLGWLRANYTARLQAILEPVIGRPTEVVIVRRAYRPGEAEELATEEGRQAITARFEAAIAAAVNAVNPVNTVPQEVPVA